MAYDLDWMADKPVDWQHQMRCFWCLRLVSEHEGPWRLCYIDSLIESATEVR